MASLGVVEARSRVYETAPLGPPQPDYLNAVVRLRSSLEPEEILDGMLALEASLGRERRERWGPRLIDLDLLAAGDLVLDTPRMTLPHPGIPHRAFVLRPWLDIAPEFVVPGQGSVRSLWAALPAAEQGSVRVHAAGGA